MTPLRAELVVAYPRKATVGQRYEVTVDLAHEAANWAFDTEEYPIRCIVEAEAFKCESDGDAAIVLHRFGGTYGPARFILEASEAGPAAEVLITLIDARGTVIRSRLLEPIEITEPETVSEVLAPPILDDYAVVIGLTDYPQIPMSTPAIEADLFTDWVTASDGGAVPDARVLAIRSGHRDTGSSIRAALKTIPSCNRLYIFAAGHGTDFDGVAMFAGSDLANLETSLVDLQEFASEALDRGLCHEVVLIMDTDRMALQPHDVARVRTVPRPQRPAYLFAFATAEGQSGYEYVDEDEPRSPFARAVLETLWDGRDAGLTSSKFTRRVAERTHELLKGLSGQTPEFAMGAELQLVAFDESTTPRGMPGPAVWIREVLVPGEEVEVQRTSAMSEDDFVVVLGDLPVQPVGLYSVSALADSHTATCSLRFSFPKLDASTLAAIPDIGSLVRTSADRDARMSGSIETLLGYAGLLRTTAPEHARGAVALEYGLISPMSAPMFKGYRQMRIQEFASAFREDVPEDWADLPRNIEAISLSGSASAMRLWRTVARSSFKFEHVGIGLADLKRSDIDEIEAVAAYDINMVTLHEHLLRHPNRSSTPPHRSPTSHARSNSGDALSKALDTLEQITGTDYNQIFLVVPTRNGSELRVAAEAIAPHKARYDIASKGGIIDSARDGVLNIGDVSRNKRYIAAVRETRAELAVPIRIGKRDAVGVLNSEAEKTNHFTSEMVRQIASLAESLARMIDSTVAMQLSSSLGPFVRRHATGTGQPAPAPPAPSPDVESETVPSPPSEGGWTGPRKRQLRDAMLDAFPSRRELSAMTYFHLDFNLDHEIAPDIALSQVVFEVIRWAEMNGRLTALVVAMRSEAPANTKLRQLAEEMGLSPKIEPEVTRLVGHGGGFLDIAMWREAQMQVEGQVCRVEIDRSPAGTGVLIGPDLVLTARHVVPGLFEGPRPHCAVRFDHKVAAQGTVVDGRPCELSADWLVDDSPIEELDFAVLRLAEPIGIQAIDSRSHLRGWVRLSDKEPVVPRNGMLVMVQHPQGRPMKISIGTTEGFRVTEDGQRVRYQLETGPGSSGAPVFDGEWRLLALHHRRDERGNRFKEGIPVWLIARRPRVAAALHEAEPSSNSHLE